MSAPFIDLRIGDCLESIKSIPDGSVNLVLCDLPYGGSKTGFAWDCRIDLVLFWEQVCRILHPKGVVVGFGTQPFTTTLIASNLGWFRYPLIWQKTKPSNFFHCWSRPLSGHEDIMVFAPGNATSGSQNDAKRSTYHPQGLVRLLVPVKRRRDPNRSHYLGKRTKWDGGEQKWTNFPRSILKFASVHKGDHPTQKPVDLLRYLIRTYSNPGDVVLDPTMGAGSTGVAVVAESRSFIGIELGEKFYRIACQRIDGAGNYIDREAA